MTPSNEEAKWQRHYRDDKGIWEDICPHGIGHENGVHGCDGCCKGLYTEKLQPVPHPESNYPEGSEQQIGCQCEECKITMHYSDCAVHREPYEPKGKCNCKSTSEQQRCGVEDGILVCYCGKHSAESYPLPKDYLSEQQPMDWEKKVQHDLDKGLFFHITANDQTLKEYIFNLLSNQQKDFDARVEGIIGEHNARILNQYQLCDLGDETVLFKPIENATTETLALAKQRLQVI